MTERDILISRVFDEHGTPALVSPLRQGDDAHDRWRVTATGRAPQVLVTFRAALDLALVWANESGGEIYRITTANAEPELFKPTG